jgi:tetratricopeptide (TPR) repeat protein
MRIAQELFALVEKSVSARHTPTPKLAEYTTTSPLLDIEGFLHLTLAYAKQGEVEKASEMAEWAVRLACKLESHAGLAMATQAVAELFLATGDSKRARKAFSKSVDLWENAGRPKYPPETRPSYSVATSVNSQGESKETQAEMTTNFGTEKRYGKIQAALRRSTT